MITLSAMSSIIQRRLSGGNVSYNLEITSKDIKRLIVQVVAKMLKMETPGNFAFGDMFPPSTMIATYNNIAVASYGTQRSISEMPAFPISLPKTMGVWQVADMNNPDRLFIPLQSGEWGIINQMDYLPQMSGNIAYETEGQNVIYTTDITKNYPNPVIAVRMKLLVTDVSTLTDWDLLPIPQDMEGDVILTVYQMVAGEPVGTHDDSGKDPRPSTNASS